MSTLVAFRRARGPRLIAVAILVALLIAGCGDDDDTPAGADEAVRDELGQTAPANAPGQRLYLERVTIAAGTQLASHFHDGTQVAYIESGTLTYNIVSGSAGVTRAGGTIETLEGPTVTTLEAGDSIVETHDLIHFGSNETDKPVIVVLAALLAEDAGLSTPVED